MRRLIILAGAAGAGAGLMYLLDPDRGKRRRGELRDKAVHISHVALDAAGKTKRDAQNHLRGLAAEIDSIFRTREISDEVLQARVRSKMGRVVSHPHAVNVTVRHGDVILRGSILADELHSLLSLITEVDGVRNVDNWLETHQSADVPELQGGRQRRVARFGPFKTNWSPTTRLVATVAGGVMAVYGARRRGVVGSGLGLAGAALATRALTNVGPTKFIGASGKIAEPGLDSTMEAHTAVTAPEVVAASVA